MIKWFNKEGPYTCKQWNKLGFHIIAGEHSTIFDEKGNHAFTRNQVIPVEEKNIPYGYEEYCTGKKTPINKRHYPNPDYVDDDIPIHKRHYFDDIYYYL